MHGSKQATIGRVALETDARRLTIDVADGSLPRIDAVCVRLDKTRTEPRILVKKGRVATQPSITPPVRNLDYDEIYIATILGASWYDVNP